MLIISFNINAYAKMNTKTVLNSDINGITLISNHDIDINNIKTHGFNLVVLNAYDIRKPVKPYNTDYKALRLLGSNISKLEAANIDYIIAFSSGPGFSEDGKTETIYKRKYEMNYFSKMIKEIVRRYNTHPNFKGISVNLMSPDVTDDKYYYLQDYIVNDVRTSYSELPVMYNLNYTAFEDDYKYMPALKLSNIALNLTIGLKALSYPGYGAGYKASCSLSKNALLSSLEKLKEFKATEGSKTIITLKTPWVKNSEVMLQDLFEIYKILKFNYNLAYGNSKDIYDLTTNKDVLRVIDRHNK